MINHKEHRKAVKRWVCTVSSSLGVGCGGVFFQASTSMSHVRTEWKSFFRKSEYDMSLVMIRHTCLHIGSKESLI